MLVPMYAGAVPTDPAAVVGEAPPWLADWIAPAEPRRELVELVRAKFAIEPAAVRAIAIRFPPGSAVQCACGCTDCGRSIGVVRGYTRDRRFGARLDVEFKPSGTRGSLAPDAARLVGFHGGLTSAITWLVIGTFGTA